MARANQARLDLAALRHNLQIARTLAQGAKVMAVVKANAYGHGAVTIAETLAPLADALAVACIEEAIELREAGIEAPILLLEGVFEASEFVTAAEHGFWATIDSETQLNWLEQSTLPKPVHCWLKIDTGMHRLGVQPEKVSLFYERLKASPNATDEITCCTHFASADNLDSLQTNSQLAVFESASAGLNSLRSAANSPALLGWPEAIFDWVRPGYMLYGNSPFPQAHPNADLLKPVMTLTSAVISLRTVAVGEPVGYAATWIAERESVIATVSVGYGDGYPRTAQNGTPVLVAGQRAKLAGRVSMDMITVDVTDIDGVAIGDEVVLWGNGLPVGEVSEHSGTIGYELVTRMPKRTPRVVTVE